MTEFYANREDRPQIERRPFPRRESHFVTGEKACSVLDTKRMKFESHIVFENADEPQERTLRDSQTFKKRPVDVILPNPYRE